MIKPNAKCKLQNANCKINNKLRINKNKGVFLVGLTGGFGTGKTTVAKEFARLGAKVIDVDKIARDITKPGFDAYRDIVREFGTAILKKNKEIDRKKLADIVFNDNKKRKILEHISHPRIIGIVNKQIRSLGKPKKHFVILEAPLLYEVGLDRYMDKNIVVWVPFKVQVSRIKKRDKLNRPEILARIKAQIPLNKKLKLADHKINNSLAGQKIKEQVKNIWEGLTKNK
ncbi:MAG: dephospho-CoA kinase [Elusimicrobia bacterium]|nr:dephospho-CoA kinase [Candidatus Liberimonas magnetica]